MENTVIVALVTLAIFWFLWKKAATDAPLPPGPRGLPIVGYLPFLATDLHIQLTQLANIYGPIYKLRVGSTLAMVINSPSLAKEVVWHNTFSERVVPVVALTLTYGGMDMAFGASGTNWRTLRKVFVREIMSKASLDACYNLRKEEVFKGMKRVSQKIGTPIAVGEIVYDTAVDAVMRLVWGDCCSKITAELREVVEHANELLGKQNLSDYFPMLARFDIQGVDKEMKRQVLRLDRIIDSVIDQRMKGEVKNTETKDILQLLLDYNKQEDSSTHLSLTQIKSLLVDLVVGGAEGIAITTEWAMAEMMHKPVIMKNAQEEVAQVVGMNNIVEESLLPKMQYLDAVVKEALRLHPAGPLLLPRCAAVSCKLGGYTVPKGTQIWVNIWALHRDPKVWDNPSEFKPERFFNDSSKWDYTGSKFQYIPFGSGRRMCPGIALADMIIKYTLASLLHAFNWQLPQGEKVDLSEKFGLNLKKQTPLIGIPSQRSYPSDFYA